MSKKDEALKLALEALEYIYEGANNQGPHTGISWRCVSKKAAPVITALRQALANEALDKMAENARELGLDYEPAQQQKEGFASPGGGYVPAIPRPMPLDWKLVPRKATPEMLKAMDECAQEGYDERLYAGMASSVYMAAWDASPVMGTLPEQPAQQEPVVWMYVNKSTHETKFQKQMRGFVDHSLWSEVPLYGEPLANHELQCVCGAVWLGDEMVHLPDKHPPAQRTWVGLTDEEIVLIVADCASSHQHTDIHFARAIEAKLKENNNG